jgi:hypothetical protein
VRHPTLLLALLTLAACAGGDDPDDDTDAGDTEVTAGDAGLRGAWKVVGDATALAWMEIDDVEHLLLDDDLVLRVYASNEARQRTCAVGTWGGLGDGLVLRPSLDAWVAEHMLLVVASTADTLTLTDPLGRTLQLEREDAVPTEARCGVAALGQTIEVDQQKASWSNLIWDGAALRLPTEDGVYAVDAATGALSDPWTYPAEHDSYVHPMTWDDGATWNDCGCGRNADLKRLQPDGTVLDQLDTTDVGGPVSVWTAASDGAHLVVYGPDENERRFLLQVSTDAEPDRLDSGQATALDLRVLAFHRGELYGLHGNGSLFRIDRGTGTATSTWTLPADPEGHAWEALASDGTDLWVAKRSATGETIAKVSLGDAP